MRLCRVLRVSRSGYYRWAKRAGRSNEKQMRPGEARLRLEVRAAFRGSAGTYGSPRVHREMRAQGIRCGRKRVEQIMRAEGLRATPVRRAAPRTTDSAHAFSIAPNLLERRFSVAQSGGINRVWVADITYLPTRQGGLYLATVLDLGSRRVVGWAMQDTLEGSLTLDALRRAVRQRRPGPGLIHHSDQLNPASTLRTTTALCCGSMECRRA